MIPAAAFGCRIPAGSNRHPLIASFIDDHLDPGAGRVKAAVFRYGVKCGAGLLTGAAPVAFAEVHFYLFDYFLCRFAHCSFTSRTRNRPKIVYLPNFGVGVSFQILDVLKYACGLKQSHRLEIEQIS
jgi:hypothetical protein